MDWQDDGIILSVRKHGETSAIVNVLTRAHGRHAGLVRGGGGKRLSGILQPGNKVQARWHARLPEHLGTFTVEPIKAFAAAALPSPSRPRSPCPSPGRLPSSTTRRTTSGQCRPRCVRTLVAR